MDKKIVILLGAAGAIALLVLFFLSSGKEKTKKVAKTEESEEFLNTKNFSGYSDTMYPDAPSPFANADAEEEAKSLWPTAIKSVKDDAHREKVREEWRDFASKYPKNIYVLNEYRAPLTEKEAADRRSSLDSFTSVDTYFFRETAKLRSAEIGKDPAAAPKDAGVTSDQQRAYFDYKIKEVESRIELIQYAREQKGLSSDQDGIADRDIAQWKKELEDLQKVSKTVPNI